MWMSSLSSRRNWIHPSTLAQTTPPPMAISTAPRSHPTPHHWTHLPLSTPPSSHPQTANWTGCVSGAARFDQAPGGAAILFSAPTSRTERTDLGLFVSTDEAQSWSGPTTMLWKGPAAYSSMVMVNATHAAILFENGDAGTGNFAQRISMVLVDASDL